MKPKTLIPLAVILVILLGLVFFRSATKENPTLVEQVEYATLVPADLEAKDIDKLEFYSGAAPDDKVVLVREGDKAWRIESQFNAPASAEVVDEFLGKLLDVRGEFRADATSDEARAQYNLKTDQAFHVAAYAGTGETPELHLLVGKAPDFRTVFLRQAEGEKVYVEQTNLRREAGVFDDSDNAKPEATKWIQKDITKFEQAALEKIHVVMPDKSLTLEKQTTEAPAPAADGEAAAGETPVPAVESKWVVAEGGLGGALLDRGRDNLLSKAASLQAIEVVDPAKVAEYGLEPPAYRMEIQVADEDDVVLEGGRPDPSGDGYVRVANAEPPVVYKVSKFNFEQLFPKGGDLFELSKLSFPKDQIASVEIARPEGTLTAQQTAGTWTISQPAVGLAPQTAMLNNMATTLSNWKPADYAAPGTHAGTFDTTITVLLPEGPRVLSLGGASKHIEGRYARLDGSDTLLVMSRADVDKVVLEPRKAFQMGMFDLLEDDVQTLALSLGDDASGTLQRTPEGWTLTAGGNTLPADSAKVGELLTSVVTLQATDLRLDKATFDVAPWGSITLAGSGGESTALTLGPDEGGSHLLKRGDERVLFAIDAGEVAQLRTALLGLREAATPAPAADAAEMAPEAAPTADAAPEAAENASEIAADVVIPADLGMLAPPAAGDAGTPTLEAAPTQP